VNRHNRADNVQLHRRLERRWERHAAHDRFESRRITAFVQTYQNAIGMPPALTRGNKWWLVILGRH
jgi:hypothetical protein